MVTALLMALQQVLPQESEAWGKPGSTSAALSAYQSVSQNVLSNADTILSQKVANIETVCKMLDTQSDIVRKMLKDDMESNSKEIDNL